MILFIVMIALQKLRICVRVLFAKHGNKNVHHINLRTKLQFKKHYFLFGIFYQESTTLIKNRGKKLKIWFNIPIKNFKLCCLPYNIMLYS